ncbi:ABC transporter ATP-binding protein [Bosea sp. 117]|uniref:ABC transporter ATP-binding protein n=1 Tax=Bosea sp. 117 TaxID=1125973 RepID=UPI000494A7C6|nr:ABC transporter ATP-binding protein [Bosea sp. 117]
MSVEINRVSKRFGALTVVDGVSVDIRDGEFFVMLGSSGCGKTTTLRMVAGLEMPSAGSIRIKGRDVTYAEPRNRDIAMAFQDYGLYPHMTVEQNIEFPLKVRKVAEGERKAKVRDIAERLGIAEFLARRPMQLSGGQRQRVSLARALVRNPHVFLMDEPLSNLDAKLRATMRAEIKQLVSRLGITTIYVTHDQIEAMAMADRIAVMSNGRMVQIGSPLEVYDRPKTKFVAGFMGAPPMNLFRGANVNGRVTATIQPFADGLSDDDRASAAALGGAEFHVGIRPEHLVLGATGMPGVVNAQVAFVEPLGANTNVYLTVGELSFVANVERTSHKAGDVVEVAARPGHLRLVTGDEVVPAA